MLANTDDKDPCRAENISARQIFSVAKSRWRGKARENKEVVAMGGFEPPTPAL